jgi:hypothetical protein
VHDEVGDLLEFAGLGDVEYVVAAVVQIVAGFTDGADCGVAGRSAGQRNGFFGFEPGRFIDDVYTLNRLYSLFS